MKISYEYINLLAKELLNKYMGFDKNIRLPRYIIDTEGLSGKKIAIYGFGEVGQDIFWILNKFNYDISLVVDKNYKYYHAMLYY